MENKEQEIEEILSRGVAEVIDQDHLKAQLLSGQPLRIKLGIDPTSAHIHLGRAVVLLKMRDLQQLGHKIVLIVGDFTGVIGDTSDKESERPMLEKDAIEVNMKTYTEQLGKLIDLTQAEVHYNSTWLGKLGYEDIGTQANAFSVAEFISRDNIRKRLDEGKRVSLREMLYPLMQGFDSIAVNADVELGGIDQRFNLLAGRRLQETHGQAPQDLLMTNLILGTDGRKMSSSWGNTINLTDTPNDMFGKIMSIPDTLITEYFVHCTRVPMTEIATLAEEMVTGGNPRDAKVRLAKEIVRLYHGDDEARAAEKYFVDTFSKGVIPENIREQKVEWYEPIKSYQNLQDFIVSAGLAESKSDARRKIEQGGIYIDGVRTVEVRILSKDDEGKVVQVGKKDFVKIVFTD
ncbi:MAG: tyrosine--tRNA ligase [Candidatus Moranbacteria bacterium]|jgi:tyrosyl-tRNA synthetase|nr:tyrosine--tRNA ligase [Candidatus Moranbacteria bacterium]